MTPVPSMGGHDGQRGVQAHVERHAAGQGVEVEAGDVGGYFARGPSQNVT